MFKHPIFQEKWLLNQIKSNVPDHPDGISKADFKDLVTQFFRADKDGDGFLNFNEFLSCLGYISQNPALAGLLFRAFDPQCVGFIDLGSYVRQMFVLQKGTDEERVRMGYSMWTKSNQDLSKDDVYRFVRVVFGVFHSEANCDKFAQDIYENLHKKMDDSNSNQIQITHYKELIEENPRLFTHLGYTSKAVDENEFQNVLTIENLDLDVYDDGSFYGMKSTTRPNVLPISNPSISQFGYVELSSLNLEGKNDVQPSVNFTHRESDPRDDAYHYPPATLPENLYAELSTLKIKSSVTRGARGKLVGFGHHNLPLILTIMNGLHRAILHLPPGAHSVVAQQHISSSQPEIHMRVFFPKTFKAIRTLYRISDESFAMSLGPITMFGNLLRGILSTLSEIMSEGKSGDFFYFSGDRKYVIKTIPTQERDCLLHIMPNYFTYLKENPDTLLTRYFGLFQLEYKTEKKKEISFVVMQNLFNIPDEVQEIFDLKGSSKNRRTKETKDSGGQKKILKDENFLDRYKPDGIILESEEQSISLWNQLKKDSEFLQSFGIMDYSLLLIICKPATHGSIEEQEIKKDLEGKRGNLDLLKTKDGRILAMGIIDSITLYGMKRKLERFFKMAICHSGEKISVAPPSLYSKRFIRETKKYFGGGKS